MISKKHIKNAAKANDNFGHRETAEKKLNEADAILKGLDKDQRTRTEFKKFEKEYAQQRATIDAMRG